MLSGLTAMKVCADEPLVVLERAQRRLLPGRVAVEGEDDLAGAASSVSISSRRSTPMWSAPKAVPQVATAVGHPGQVAGHHVGVPLDDHRPALLGDLPLGLVDAVEHVRLLVDRRLRGVEVLRAVVVVEQLARAEADHVAGEVADRPQQPAAEPVDQRAASGPPGPARR